MRLDERQERQGANYLNQTLNPELEWSGMEGNTTHTEQNSGAAEPSVSFD